MKSTDGKKKSEGQVKAVSTILEKVKNGEKKIECSIEDQLSAVASLRSKGYSVTVQGNSILINE